ncbi:MULTISPECIES: hypothetical protein [Pasteurellaceae]|uniref:hypothetical protein n=1 Tax=Pasteurellaceae TaxID=712 RepID=UPI000530FB44|nr:hypothetical protein [Gallibacterium anatis]KGQ48584.1 hypothetical protein JL12_08970 [Gallibacterium anatis 10672-6]
MARKTKIESTEKKIETADVVLRAFKITNPHTTQKVSNLREKLEDVLETEDPADKRCLILNPEDNNKEQDLISDYSCNGKSQSIFCTLLRMKLGNGVQHITDDLLNSHKFSLTELKERSIKAAGIYQRHYYFSILGDYLVTGAMPLNQTIKQLQTYLSWLLEDETLELTPMIEPPKECKLSDLTSATFKDPDFDLNDNPNEATKSESVFSDDDEQVSHPVTPNQEVTETKTSWLNRKVIQRILPQIMQESLNLKEIDDLAKIVSAQLVVKFSKPRKMAQEDYEKILGATLKPISDIENVQFKTKDKKRMIKGKDLLKSKIVKISKTESGHLVEEELKQSMACYLREISQ